MSDNISVKAYNKLKDFLNERRVTNDQNAEITHLSYPVFNGKFSLSKDDRKEFTKLYISALNANCELTILEKPKEYAPIIVDIDLEKPRTENIKRLYNTEMIKVVIEKYMNAINKYIKINNEDDLTAFVFEKESPSIKDDDTYKDGFHILFPELCIQTNTRHLIRNDVVKSCIQDDTFDGYLNSPDKIIDKSVVSSNGWFMYGSKKLSGYMYKLTRIYDVKMDNIYSSFEEKENINDLVIRFSLQHKRYSKKNRHELVDGIGESDINIEVDKLDVKSQNILTYSTVKEDEIRRAIKYLEMLSDKRSDDYHDWINVGLALHNIEDSLLENWIHFSKRSKKYKEGECNKIWKGFKCITSGNVLTIRSLAYWGKMDNPKKYETFIKEEFKNIMRKSLDGNTYYLAKSVYAKYNDKYVCSSIKNDIWWEFKSHKWVKVEGAYTLKTLLSEDFSKEYNTEIGEISLALVKDKLTASQKEEYLSRREKLSNIVNNLMKTNFKETLIKECKNLFYDDKFELKLDSNINLVGFKNGVYDLEKEEFREGRPDDYITMCTNHNYVKWSEKNPLNSYIFKFFEQVYPNKEVREYFLSVLSTCVSGNTKEEKFFIMTGSGSNGKSLTNDLMKMSLGDYYMSCDISLITRKRGQSNQASPERVRMKGRRCGVFQEADDGEKMNVGILKEITGGDTMLIRDLFKGANDMIEFKPQMKYFLTANQLPEVTSNDDGTWRRICVIDFVSKFVNNPKKQNEFQIDTSLKQKIESWAPTFISYLIHRFITIYKKNGLIEPQEVKLSTQQYKKENDFMTDYFINNIIITNERKDKVRVGELFEHFKGWCKDNSYTKKMPTRPELVKNIANQLGIKDEVKLYLYGIKLYYEENENDHDDDLDK
jgi:P4 family phage/plasmid primase-like protien